MDEYARVDPFKDIQLDVKVLTAGFWPSDSIHQARLPRYLVPHADFFQEFYLSRHTGRKLSWKTSLGTAEIRGYMGSNRNKHEFIMSTFQMLVIMLFNDVPLMTLEEISAQLNVPSKDLEKHVLGLIHGKLL
jgi:hypothetical protein